MDFENMRDPRSKAYVPLLGEPFYMPRFTQLHSVSEKLWGSYDHHITNEKTGAQGNQLIC